MKVLGLCSYPIESAATRYRLVQFIKPLAQENLDLVVSPFLESEQFHHLYKNKSQIKKALGLGKPLMRRLSESLKMQEYDLLFVQREAMFFGPAFFEWIYQRIGNIPMILDLDDATYIRYVSPTYGKLGSFFKFFGKTDRLIGRADAVICGNRFIAEYVEGKGAKAVVIPTVVDTDKFFPVETTNETPVIGWIGTHSTFPFLEAILPVLKKLSSNIKFILRIVGSGQERINIDGLKVENLDWRLERETKDFQSFDIGLYPMELGGRVPDQWIAGKSGFKAIQYMAVGVPFVMSPIGVCAEIGIEGETHFAASTLDQWERHLVTLLKDKDLRKKMGGNARKYSEQHYSLDVQAGKLIEVIRFVAGAKQA